MVAIWIMVAVVWLIAGGIVYVTTASPGKKKSSKAVEVLLVLVCAAALTAFCLWSLYGTESGKRSIKSFESNVSGGVERTVTVYDMDGDVIATYSGKFDVDYTDERILFDDEDGKRHVIYFKSGTVVIDEN